MRRERSASSPARYVAGHDDAGRPRRRRCGSRCAARIRSPPRRRAARASTASLGARCTPARPADRPAARAAVLRHRRRRHVDDRHDRRRRRRRRRRGRPAPSRCAGSLTSGATSAAHARTSVAARSTRASARASRAACSLTDALALLVVVGGDAVGRRQDLFHRLVEPAIDGGEHDLCCRRSARARPGSASCRAAASTSLARNRANGSAAPPFDQQLDDVARQHEHQRQQHHEVGAPTARRGRPRSGSRATARDVRSASDEQAGQHREEHDDAGEDQPRVVAERPPARRAGAAALPAVRAAAERPRDRHRARSPAPGAPSPSRSADPSARS